MMISIVWHCYCSQFQTFSLGQLVNLLTSSGKKNNVQVNSCAGGFFVVPLIFPLKFSRKMSLQEQGLFAAYLARGPTGAFSTRRQRLGPPLNIVFAQRIQPLDTCKRPAGFRMKADRARRLYANSTQIPSRRYLYRLHTSEGTPESATYAKPTH